MKSHFIMLSAGNSVNLVPDKGDKVTIFMEFPN